MTLPDIEPHHLLLRIPEIEMETFFHKTAKNIGVDYFNDELTMITIFDGAVQFRNSVLMRLLNQTRQPKLIRHDSLKVQSYGGGTTTNHNPEMKKYLTNPEKNIYRRKVLVVEDMIDTGVTMAKTVLPYIFSYEPAEVAVAVMLTNTDRLEVDIDNLLIKYRGPNVNFFAVGHGLDVAQRYRNEVGIHEVVWDK